MVLKMACADGIQECLENVRDLQAYNTQEDYMKGLTAKIKAMKSQLMLTEAWNSCICRKFTDDFETWNCYRCTCWWCIVSKRGIRYSYLFHGS